MDELWRRLKLGDKVRVVSWPPELHADRMHQETFDCYQWLISSRVTLTIVKIDGFGLPFGEAWRTVGDTKQYEYLALNHGGLEMVDH